MSPTHINPRGVRKAEPLHGGLTVEITRRPPGLQINVTLVTASRLANYNDVGYGGHVSFSGRLSLAHQFL